MGIYIIITIRLRLVLKAIFLMTKVRRGIAFFQMMWWMQKKKMEI